MKIGICTGGGDCPGLNLAIYSFVRCLTHLTGGVPLEIIGVRSGLSGLISDPPNYQKLDIKNTDHLPELGGTYLHTVNSGSPFRDSKQAAEFEKAFSKGWKALGLDGLVVIGGDGTQGMAKQLVAKGFNIVGIPKTIDNDMPGCDQTIGFHTAVEIATQAAMRLRSSAYSHERLMILEVMGRDSGYIALHAGLAAQADIILIPEQPYSIEAINKYILQQKKLRKDHFLVVTAEGAFTAGGQPSYFTTSTGTRVLGGVSHALTNQISEHTGLETRATILGHIQRGGLPNTADRLLAIKLATKAANLVAQNQYGSIVCYKDQKIYLQRYQDLPEERRKVQADDIFLATARDLGICLGTTR